MTLKEQLNNANTYEQFINEKTLDKKKFWNKHNKFLYIPSLKYAFKMLKQKVDNGECVDEIMKQYL